VLVIGLVIWLVSAANDDGSGTDTTTTVPTSLPVTTARTTPTTARVVPTTTPRTTPTTVRPTTTRPTTTTTRPSTTTTSGP
jgi:hypothetical protein